jgi:hypothetical protein
MIINNMKDAARAAIAVQSASNLSGVAKTFANVQSVLLAEADRLGKGTDWRNSHPVVQLFLVQMAHLANLPIDLEFDYMKAATAVEEIAGETIR